MGKGIKYNLQHMGDHFVDGLEKGFRVIKASTKGISLTYDIHDLEKRRLKACRRIGERIAQVRRISPENDLFSDEKLTRLFSILDGIDEKIEASHQEREDRLNPGSRMIEAGEIG